MTIALWSVNINEAINHKLPTISNSRTYMCCGGGCSGSDLGGLKDVEITEHTLGLLEWLNQFQFMIGLEAAGDTGLSVGLF